MNLVMVAVLTFCSWGECSQLLKQLSFLCWGQQRHITNEAISRKNKTAVLSWAAKTLFVAPSSGRKKNVLSMFFVIISQVCYHFELVLALFSTFVDCSLFSRLCLLANFFCWLCCNFLSSAQLIFLVVSATPDANSCRLHFGKVAIKSGAGLS